MPALRAFFKRTCPQPADTLILLQMLAGMGEPVLKAGAKAGGFEAGRGELVEGVPFEADPVLCGGEGFVRGDAFDGQFKD